MHLTFAHKKVVSKRQPLSSCKGHWLLHLHNLTDLTLMSNWPDNQLLFYSLCAVMRPVHLDLFDAMPRSEVWCYIPARYRHGVRQSPGARTDQTRRTAADKKTKYHGVPYP